MTMAKLTQSATRAATQPVSIKRMIPLN